MFETLYLEQNNNRSHAQTKIRKIQIVMDKISWTISEGSPTDPQKFHVRPDSFQTVHTANPYQRQSGRTH